MEHALGEAGDYSGGRFLRFVAAIATLVASSALAAVVAWWGWQLFGPAPVHIAATAPADPAATLIAANLFGGGRAPPSAVAPDAALSGNARLLGIIAEPQKQGYALFSLSGGPKLVAVGQEITPGVKVIAIAPDTVTLREGASERHLRLWPEQRTGGPIPPGAAGASPQAVGAVAHPPSRSVAAGTAVASARCAPPAGFRGAVIRLNAELLGGLGSDPGPWRALFAATPQGLVVTHESGFSAMLGLKAGDRIAEANGIALHSPDDVTSAVLRPLIADQGVHITGSRGGAPQELWLANVACSD